MTESRQQEAPDDPVAATSGHRLPVAEVRRPRRISWLWLVPALAVALAAGLVHRTWTLRGVVVTVRFEDGRGLKPGDPVRYRGITVGEVRRIELASDLEGVVITAGLRSQGRKLARRGSRFWVVHPEIGLGGVEGLETLLGPRYMEVLPGDGPPHRHFVGLQSPPIVQDMRPDDLQVIVRATRRGGLRPGAPVLYRQVRVGTVLSVGLTSDASAVEARLHIGNKYTKLIRQRTRFWRVPGVEAEFGLSGMALDVDSLETLLLGGIALATPPLEDAGETVLYGHRFELADEPDDDWLRWEPVVATGDSMLPAGLSLPECVRAKIAWRQGALFKGSKSREGWLLPTGRGLLGPRDLLVPGRKADEETVVLEVAGRMVGLEEGPSESESGLALLEANLPVEYRPWPGHRIRSAATPEDCIAVGDPTAGSLPLAASRLQSSEDGWIIDRSVPVDPQMHGAAVVARSDGRLVGVILIGDDERPIVALVPGDWWR